MYEVAENKKSLKSYSIEEITEINDEIVVSYFKRLKPCQNCIKTYDMKDIERVLAEPLHCNCT